MNCECRDLCCKVERGFNGSKVMRSKKQQKKLESHPTKKAWLKEDKGEKEGSEADLPMFERDGQTFVDLNELLSSGNHYTDSGRPRYLDPALVPIREFNPPEDTPKDPSFIAYGKRRTGKTFLARWWMWYFRNYYDQVYVYSDTLVNGFWQQYIPPKACIPGWNEEHAKGLIAFNEWAVLHPEEAARKGYSAKTLTWLDDVISNTDLRQAGDDGSYASLYVQGRHNQMSVGTNTQKATALPPKVRDNIDLVFVLRQESGTEMERLWKEHMSRLNRRTAFELMEMWTRTENYKQPNEQRWCLVIDTDPCKSYNERFMYAKAFDPGPFKMGSKIFQREMQ